MSKPEEFGIRMTEDGLTLEEIAIVLGVTRERVRQIEMNALKKLKHPSLRDKWREVLETKALLDAQRL